MTVDVNTLSKDELQKLKADVEKALKSIDSRRKLEAKKAADAAAKQFGFSLDELVETDGKPGKGIPKFANPADPAQTWTGRGRKPNWVIAWLNDGKAIEDLAI